MLDTKTKNERLSCIITHENWSSSTAGRKLFFLKWKSFKSKHFFLAFSFFLNLEKKPRCAYLILCTIGIYEFDFDSNLLANRIS